jgi:hypothetical protein
MDSANDKKLAKLLDFEQKFKDNPEVAVLSEIEGAIQPIEETIETIQDGAEKIVEAVNELDQTKASKQELEYAMASVQTQKGDRGFKGEKGDKGDNGKDGRDGVDGKDGRDGIDGKDGESAPFEAVAQLVLETIEIPEETGESIIEKINQSEEQIEVGRIKGIKSYDAEIATLQNRTQLLNQIATTRGGGSSTAETDPLSFHLDQTTPQTITGKPTFPDLRIIGDLAVTYDGDFVDTVTINSRVVTFNNDGSDYTSWEDSDYEWTPTYDVDGKLTAITIITK